MPIRQPSFHNQRECQRSGREPANSSIGLRQYPRNRSPRQATSGSFEKLCLSFPASSACLTKIDAFLYRHPLPQFGDFFEKLLFRLTGF